MVLSDILTALLLLSIWALISGVCGVVGYVLGRRQCAAKPNKLSEEDQRKIEQERRELKNFYTYNGDPQGS